jgi:Carbohydrate esterase, sialic acid-specific acetylesterase
MRGMPPALLRRRRGAPRAAVCGLLAAALLPLSGCGHASEKRAKASVKTPLLFIFAGQSNMVGLGTDASDVQVSGASEPTLVWNAEQRTWQPLLPASGHFGPELTALPELASRLHRPVAAVKVAVSGSNLFNDWNPDRPDGLYAQLVDALHAAVASPPPQGRPRVAGFFWAQGDADGSYEASARAYQDSLDRFMRRVRRDVRVPTLPIVMAQVRAEYLPVRPYGAMIRSAINSVAASSANTRVVTADDVLLADGLHFTSSAMLTVGHRMADAYMELKPPFAT